MNSIHQRRLFFILITAVLVSSAIGLILYALKKNMNVFLTPQELASTSMPADYHFRLGGLVKKGSLIRDKEGLGVTFRVTDFKKEITVHYIGILPDLFREGKGMIAEGRLNQKGTFEASQILAKHDENYMPKKFEKSPRDTH